METTVQMVSWLHEVPTSQIHSWRANLQFQLKGIKAQDFAAVGVTDRPIVEEIAVRWSDAHIEITHENGRQMSISDGVDVSLVLEPARCLAA